MTSIRRTWVLWLALFAFVFTLAGCTEPNEKTRKEVTATADTDKTLTMAYTWNPGGLDPHGRDSWFVMRSGTGETLIRLNEELEPVPWLAKEWKKEDETTWVFKLEENVTFHNGKAMDAKSVKDSLLRTLNENQKARDLLQIESMKILDNDELKIKTKQPNPALISHLADPSTIILDVQSIEEEANDPALTGAFTFKQFKKGDFVEMVRYENYWGEQALLSNVIIKFITDGNTRLMALQSGDVDVATDLPIDSLSVLEKDKNIQVMSSPSLRTHMVLFNMNSPLFKEAAYRKVVDQSIPRDDIVDSVMMGYGTKAKGPFSPVLPFGKVERNESHPSIEKLMSKGGWQKNEDGMWTRQGEFFEATILTFPQRPELSVMAEVIQAELLNKGIKVNIRQVESIGDALADDDWDLSMYSMLTAHTGDPQYFLNIFYQSESQSNVSHYASDSFDQILKQLKQTSETTKRKQLALEAQTMINHDLPQSFIVHPHTVMGAKKDVYGFTPHPIEYYYIHPNIDIGE